MANLEIGHLIADRYRIAKLLGSGGMASVYLATDESSETLVALKLPHATQQSTQQRQRIIDEFKILRRLDHPGIPKAYALEKADDGREFIVMEYIAGENLASIIRKNILPPMGERIRWLREIAAALVHLHEHTVLYCDLKPDNVIVTQQNVDVYAAPVKILDFGVAMSLHSPSEAKVNFAGTTYYKSPEQHRKMALDVRSDIYSFGLVAYELLTGVKPYDVNPAIESDVTATIKISAMHLAAKIPSARAKNPEVPSDLNAVVQLCLEKKREDRYDTMVEVLECLNTSDGSSIATQVFKSFKAKLWGKRA